MRRNSVVAAFVLAKAVSDVGFALDAICVGVFVWVRTDSAATIAAAAVCLHMGGILGGRLGQRHGAHWDRRRVMVAADLARAAILVVLATVPGGAQLCCSEVTFKQALQTVGESLRVSAFGTAQIVSTWVSRRGCSSPGALADPGTVAGLVLVLHGAAVVAAVGLVLRRHPTSPLWMVTDDTPGRPDRAAFAEQA